MPENVELKARYPAREAARGILEDMGAEVFRTEEQVDTYFRVPEGRLKLREIEGQPSELIYYQRVENGGRRDCVYQIYRHPRSEELGKVLASALGVRVVVRKTREVYYLGRVKVNLDLVRDLGSFIEFEVPVEEEGPASAERKARELRKKFSIKDDDLVLCSYSDLVGS